MPLKPQLFLLLFLLFAVPGRSQLVCDFEADTTRACAPGQISFTDLSTSSRPIVYWNWDFGNSGFSSRQNPSRVYPTPGIYTVKLTVSDGVDTCTVTKTSYIHIFKTPTANFTLTELSNCRPKPVNFADNSTLGDAPIKTYSWDYGDLTAPGSGSTSNHTYIFNGTYSVILTVVDTNGCVSTSPPKNVTVDAPEAIFFATPRADCLPPLAVTFSNNSTGKAPLSYNWTFGDGATSTATAPNNTYTTSGFFDVTLVVTDGNGCKDTLRRNNYITIGKTESKFDIPDTICPGSTIKMQNNSTGANSFLWTVSPGGTSAQREPKFTFPNVGTYTITLAASAGPNCKDTLVKTIYAEEVNADFVISYDSICNPNAVRFTDSSSSNVTKSNYFIDMGPNKVDVTLSGLNAQFNFPKSYCRNTYYQVTYTATSKNGCSDTSIKSVKIFNDQLVGLVNTQGACVPANLTFSVQPCLRFKPVSWKWNFGTGNPADTSNVQNPSNVITVTKRGRYLATVQVTDSVGCTYKHNVSYEFGEKPKAAFNMSEDTICFGDEVIFTNLSTDSTKINSYAWLFGDNSFGTSRHEKHRYEKLGPLRVWLFVADKGCEDTTYKDLYVSGPLATILSKPDCQNLLNQEFIAGIGGGFTRHYWNLGDGSPIDSVNLNVKHTYSTPGKYTVTLIAINDTTGCRDSASFTPDSEPVESRFKPSRVSYCKNEEITFDATTSKGNINGRYFWDFGDGRKDQFIRQTKHTFTKSGTYDVTLVVLSTDSCADTSMLRVTVTSPNTNFFLPDTICYTGDSISPVNTSLPDTTTVYWEWWVNDTLRALTEQFSYPFDLHPLNRDSNLLFNQDTNYVKFVVLDTLGCIDSMKKTVYVHEVRAKFELLDSSVCRNQEIIFFDARLPSNADHIWLFGDGNSSTALEPRHKYQASGQFSSQYVVRSGSCTDTAEIEVDVQGVDSVGFWSNIRDTNCYPATLLFNDVSQGDSIVWRTWDFGDGFAPIRSPLKDSLTKTFLYPGLYTIKVVVETSNGCLDSTEYSDYIEIKGPYSEFSAYPDSLCLGEPINLVHDSSNQYTKTLVWDFADGRVDTTNTSVDTLRHVYTRTGTLLAILLMEDSSGTCTKFFQQEVVIEDVHAAFDYDRDSAGCMPFITAFADKSVDGDTWDWDFGEGNSVSKLQNPSNVFEKDGLYDVTLVYSNSRNGCKDTITRGITVFPLPEIRGFGDTIVCLGDSAQLNASGGKSYSWNPIDHLNNSLIRDPKAFPEQNTRYTVLGLDSNACLNKSTVDVDVQQVPTIVFSSGEPTIIVGETFVLEPTVEHGVVYRWEPTTGLSCSDCPNPEAKPLENTTYTLYLRDSLGCFEVEKSFRIEVEPKFSVDVPDAFTPNGDGENDIISPNGWGIKDVITFKVFNRWGEKVFEATKENPGWDGYYKGELQNVETYVYYVEVISYTGEILTKEGYFSLVR